MPDIRDAAMGGGAAGAHNPLEGPAGPIHKGPVKGEDGKKKPSSNGQGVSYQAGEEQVIISPALGVATKTVAEKATEKAAILKSLPENAAGAGASPSKLGKSKDVTVVSPPPKGMEVAPSEKGIAKVFSKVQAQPKQIDAKDATVNGHVPSAPGLGDQRRLVEPSAPPKSEMQGLPPDVDGEPSAAERQAVYAQAALEVRNADMPALEPDDSQPQAPGGARPEPSAPSLADMAPGDAPAPEMSEAELLAAAYGLPPEAASQLGDQASPPQPEAAEPSEADLLAAYGLSPADAQPAVANAPAPAQDPKSRRANDRSPPEDARIDTQSRGVKDGIDAFQAREMRLVSNPAARDGQVAGFASTQSVFGQALGNYRNQGKVATINLGRVFNSARVITHDVESRVTSFLRGELAQVNLDSLFNNSSKGIEKSKQKTINYQSVLSMRNLLTSALINHQQREIRVFIKLSPEQREKLQQHFPGYNIEEVSEEHHEMFFQGLMHHVEAKKLEKAQEEARRGFKIDNSRKSEVATPSDVQSTIEELKGSILITETKKDISALKFILGSMLLHMTQANAREARAEREKLQEAIAQIIEEARIVLQQEVKLETLKKIEEKMQIAIDDLKIL